MFSIRTCGLVAKQRSTGSPLPLMFKSFRTRKFPGLFSVRKRILFPASNLPIVALGRPLASAAVRLLSLQLVVRSSTRWHWLGALLGLVRSRKLQRRQQHTKAKDILVKMALRAVVSGSRFQGVLPGGLTSLALLVCCNNHWLTKYFSNSAVCAHKRICQRYVKTGARTTCLIQSAIHTIFTATALKHENIVLVEGVRTPFLKAGTEYIPLPPTVYLI